MIDLRKLTEQRERLQNILSGEVTITPKFFGNIIIMEHVEGGTSYLKKDKKLINTTDMLVSDLYSKPIKYLRSVAESFNRGKSYKFTNNYRTGHVILDSRDYYQPNSFPEDDIFMVSKELFEGKLDDKLKGMFETGDVDGILESMNISPEMTAIFIRNKKNPKDVFKIDIGNAYENYIPSDIYNLLQVDVIRNISTESLGKMMVKSDDPEEIYISLIDKIFLSYLGETKYDLPSIDFGYPIYMKVNPEDKKSMLSADIAEAIGNNQNLYDFYTMLLNTFKKEEHKSNIHMTDSIKERYSDMYKEITSLCKDVGINTSIPSYLEHSNK